MPRRTYDERAGRPRPPEPRGVAALAAEVRAMRHHPPTNPPTVRHYP